MKRYLRLLGTDPAQGLRRLWWCYQAEMGAWPVIMARRLGLAEHMESLLKAPVVTWMVDGLCMLLAAR